MKTFLMSRIGRALGKLAGVISGVLILTQLLGQPPELPDQPISGPGGAAYLCDSVRMSDFADKPDGYWLFEPAGPAPDSAHVVVFVHGYGGYNPMVYGAWISHLVRRGNIVIYPRYQRNMIFPRPNKFADHVATAIRDARMELDTGKHVRPIWEGLAYVGHSYGGVIISDLVINSENYGVPRPEAAMLCSSGTGWLKGGRLDDYSDMPEDLKLVVFVSENDHVVGDEFSLKVFREAIETSDRILLRQSADDHGTQHIGDGHNQPYALESSFDSGVRNYTAKKALRIATTDPVDYFGYWRIFDLLTNCIRTDSDYTSAFCDCPDLRFLGFWSDGRPVQPLEIILPDDPILSAKTPEN